MQNCFRTLAFVCAFGLACCCLPLQAQLLDASLPLQYVPLQTPCRAVDTRVTGGPIAAGTARILDPAAGACAGSIYNPNGNLIAYAVNVTAVPHGVLNYLTAWPAGELQPAVSTLNSPDGRVKANAAIVTGGVNGNISVFASNQTDVVLDVSGYFLAHAILPPGDVYFPVTPCRVIDTRGPTGEFGGPSMVAGQERKFSLTLSGCNLPPAKAYSLNITAVPKAGAPVHYVTVWGPLQPLDNGQPPPPPPITSVLNAPTGEVTANAAIVTVSTDYGYILAAVASDDTDLVVDVNGYFLYSSNAPAGGLSLYTLPPCRVLDTRNTHGAFTGDLTIPVLTGNGCSISGTAQAFVFNATVVPPGPLPFLTLWPDSTARPVVSTLNAIDGSIASNMAIVPSSNGSIDAYSPTSTQLILDMSSYFAP